MIKFKNLMPRQFMTAREHVRGWNTLLGGPTDKALPNLLDLIIKESGERFSGFLTFHVRERVGPVLLFSSVFRRENIFFESDGTSSGLTRKWRALACLMALLTLFLACLYSLHYHRASHTVHSPFKVQNKLRSGQVSLSTDRVGGGGGGVAGGMTDENTLV